MSDHQKFSAELYLMDCVALLRSLAPGSVHHIFTDPAYAALEKHRVKPNGKPRGTTTRLSQSNGSSNDWFDIFPDSRYDEFFEAAYRAMITRSHMYVMCAADDDQIDVMKQAGRKAGFRYWKRILWDKGRIGMGYHWRAQYEVILFFEKGSKPYTGKGEHHGRMLNNLGWPDVQRVAKLNGRGVTNAMFEAAMDALPPCHTLSEGDVMQMLRAVMDVEKDVPQIVTDRKVDSGDDIYPTEKPVELVERFILNSSSPGELVVDPFLGSGSTMVASLKHGRRFIGSDFGKSGMRSLNHATRRIQGRWAFDDHSDGSVVHRLLDV